MDIADLEPTTRSALILWGIALGIFLIIVIILAVRLSKSIKIAAENNSRINQYLAAVPPDRIGTINAIYQNSRKSLSGALLITIVGGVFGFQRIYLGKRRSAVVMLLFFWTGIPAVISLFDTVNMPEIISSFNLGVAESLYNQIAAPQIDK